MEALINALSNPGEMTDQQWTMILIMVVVVLGSLYFVRRFYKMAFKSRKQPYVPNIGSRRLRGGAPQTPRRKEDDSAGQ